MSGKLGSFGALSVPAATSPTPSGSVDTSGRNDVSASLRPADGAGMAARGGVKGRRPRGQGATVALTLRLERKDWARLHEVAVSDGLALADLLREGLNRALAARGLPPVDA
jgi:hypothetical protein